MMNDSGRSLDAALIQMGWLNETGEGRFPDLAWGSDLVPLLSRLEASQFQRRGRRATEWLDEAAQRFGARLIWGTPRLAVDGEAWLGPVVSWWPSGIPEGCWTGIVCSRMGRGFRQCEDWVERWQAALGFLNRHPQVLVFGANSVADRLIDASPLRANQSQLRIHRSNCSKRLGPLHRLRACERRSEPPANAGGNRFEAWVMPLPAATIAPKGDFVESIAWQERTIGCLCDRCLVPYVRPDGNVARLLTKRLTDGRWASSSNVLVRGRRQLDGPDLASAFAKHGASILLASRRPFGAAAGKKIADKSEKRASGARKRASGARKRAAAVPESARESPTGLTDRTFWVYDRHWGTLRAQELPLVDSECFLAHCTRAPNGPWPDETDRQYLQALVRSGGDRTAGDALRRMLERECILASHAAIRGRHDVVCFANIPLRDLASLRTFRRHRGRWDFEPYGIGLDREWLILRGARPVIYGDDDCWRALSPEDRPFFQRRYSRRATGAATDWSSEREWRVVGDLSLAAVPPDRAIVFVPSAEEARRVATVTRWPIVVLA